MDHEPDEREVTTEYSAGVRWLPVHASVKRTVTERFRRRSEDFIKDVEVYALADRERVAREIEGNEAFADAYLEAGAKAERTSDKSFREALARLVAAGLRDDVEVDEVAYWVTVMRGLEPAHLRFLAAVRATEDKRGRISLSVPTVPTVASRARMPIGVGVSVSRDLIRLALLRSVSESAAQVLTTDAGDALLARCTSIRAGSTDVK